MSRIVIGLCALLMFVITPSVNADPLVVTSGTASISQTARISYNLIGTNFSFTGGNGDEGNSPVTGCHPCGGPLNPVQLGGFFVGTSLGTGSATLNGTTFNNLEFLGTFSIGGGSVFLTGTQDITVTQPFDFSGEIRGCFDSALICSNEAFPTQQLVGQGLVTVVFSYSGNVNGFDIWDFKSINYTFTSAPVPEPMTITLLGAGLVGVAGRLRYKKTRKAQNKSS